MGGSNKVKLKGQPKLLQLPDIKPKIPLSHGTVLVIESEKYTSNTAPKITLHPTTCFFVSRLKIFIYALLFPGFDNYITIVI